MIFSINRIPISLIKMCVLHSFSFTVLQSLNNIVFSCAGRNIIDGPTVYKLYKNFKIYLKKSFKCVVSLCLLLRREFQMKKKNKGSTCVSTTQFHLVLSYCKT